MEEKNAKIRMLSEAGFDTEKIKLALKVTEDEIAQALDTPKEEIAQALDTSEDEPSTIVAEKKQATGSKPQYTEELWNEGKAMREQGLKLYSIAERQGFSTNFVGRMLRCNSYEEVTALREAEAKKKNEYNDRNHTSKQRNAKQNWYNANKKEKPSPTLIELRTMNDTLLRIAEALEKKRGLFRK